MRPIGSPSLAMMELRITELAKENAQLRAGVSSLHLRGVANLHGQSPNSCSACLEIWPCRTIALLTDLPDAPKEKP